MDEPVVLEPGEIQGLQGRSDLLQQLGPASWPFTWRPPVRKAKAWTRRDRVLAASGCSA